MRLTGFDAIEYAEKEGLTLHKAADSIDEAADGLSIAEAEAIADVDADLIWLEIPEDEYYGEPRNMEPGTMPTRPPKLAGQRPDELLPGQNSGPASRDKGAAGTPGGGAAAGGLGGTNAPRGEPDEDEDLEDAMAFGYEDNSGDTESTGDTPQAGPSGGAVGGTPVFKRSSPD
jgi:hypothetical protein